MELIINKTTKRFQTRSDKPNENWTNEDVYVVDDNSELAQKIQSNYPFFELVVENGELIDIELWTDQQIQDYKAQQEANREPTEMEKLEAENAELWFSIMENDTRDTSQDTDIADIWFEIMNTQ